MQRFPVPGESLTAEALIVQPGGKGLNIAAGARRLGAKIDGLMAVGDDLFAASAEAAMVKLDLPHAMLLRRDGATGAGIGFIDAAVENCLAAFPGANALLSAENVAQAGARLTLSRLVIAQYESGDEPIKAAFAAARRAGCVTILNPSPYRHVDPMILSNTDIVIVSRVEAGRLGRDLGLAEFPSQDAGAYQALAETVLRAGATAFIVTFGSGGVVAWQRGRSPIRQPAFTVEVCDTNGAGDAFNAGFATGLSENRSFEEAIRWGPAARACTAAAMGVLAALPSRDALQLRLLQPG